MCVIISKSNGIITIKCEDLNVITKYIFFSKSKALKKFRIENGLIYKHLNVIEL